MDWSILTVRRAALLVTMPWAEKRLALTAFKAVLSARRRVQGEHAWEAGLSGREPLDATGRGRTFSEHDRYRLARWVNRIGSLWGPEQCLLKAEALSDVFSRWGIVHQYRVGTRMEGEAVAAHAWIEADGRIMIGNRPDLETFIVLAERPGGRA